MDWDALSELVAPDMVWEVRSDFPDAAFSELLRVGRYSSLVPAMS